LAGIFGYYQTPAEWCFDQGVCQLVLGDYPRARQCFELCVDDGFYAWLAEYYIAVGEIVQGNFNEGMSILKQILESHPDFCSAWYLLGQVFQEQQDWSPAVECFKKAVALRPNFHPGYDRLCEALLRVDRIYEFGVYKNMAAELANPAP
jgi:tetratricopeptide (TPR) repeat protein